MKKYRVWFEASAAIGVEIEVEAASREEAKSIAAQKHRRREYGLDELVPELLKPTQDAVDGYAQRSSRPITFVTVEEDESGFEVIDCFGADED
ncbi:MAG: hypothetical protein ACM31O_14125 [Bacteroidota bacterium]